jgi:hypothetical protein
MNFFLMLVRDFLMAIYWNLKSIPEFSQMSSSEIKLKWKNIKFKIFRHWQTWFGLVGCGICAGLGSYFAALWWGSGLIGAAIGGGLGGFLYSQTVIYVVRHYYRNTLLGKEQS